VTLFNIALFNCTFLKVTVTPIDIYCWLMICLELTAPVMQSSIFGVCPKPGSIGRVATGRACGIKMGDDGGGSLIGVAPSRTVSASASVVFLAP